MKWKILKQITPETTKITPLQVVHLLLENRGITTPKEIEDFLNPITPDKIKASDLGIKTTQLNKAIKKITQSISQNKKILVYGDYDADGICGTAILWENLYQLTKNVLPYIPERVSEGYGLNEQTLKNLKNTYPDLGLIITVDHGITASEKIRQAYNLGIEIIVCDHHQPGKNLPQCEAVIHTDKICAAGIAWLLARQFFPEKSKDYLDLVAIATIADLEPLLGPNRSFAKYGLEILNQTKRCGLLAIFEEAGLTLGKIGPYEVGFIIAPRLNAMGRLEHALESLRLLCTTNCERAKKIAEKLGKTNKERQFLTEQTTQHALEISQTELQKSKLIVVGHESYNQGIIGLVAGKLVEQYHKPAIVISKGETFSKASARSINGFNIIEAIRNHSELLVEAGGHPMAAGFTIETEKIEIFKEKILQYANQQIPDELLTKTLKIDLSLPLNKIDLKLWQAISQLSPYGLGNPEPIFASEVIVKGFKTLGEENQHLKLIVSEEEKNSPVFSAVGFGMGKFASSLEVGQKVKIAYNINLNQWNGYQNIELKIKDINV